MPRGDGRECGTVPSSVPWRQQLALPFEKRRMTPEQLEMVRSRERTARSAVFATQARFVATCILIVLVAIAVWWYFADDIRAATDLRDAAVTMLQGLALDGDPALGPNTRPVVTGPTAKSGQPPYTQYAVVNGVRVGQVIDTQRRRRNKEREAYVEADVTY